MSITTAKIYTDAEGQHLTLPPEFHLDAEKVYLRKDRETGDLIVSRRPSWEEVFAALDAAPPPEDLLEPRDQGLPRHQAISVKIKYLLDIQSAIS